MAANTTEDAVRAAVGAAGAARQLNLIESGLVIRSTAEHQASALTLATAALVAGGGGACALPYTTIHKTLSSEMLAVLAAMKSGFCGATKTREKLLPRIVTTLKEEHKKLLSGIDYALGIDGGSSKLVNGTKLLPIIALSPELPEDMVLDVFLLPMHETAEIQAHLINNFYEESGLSKRRLKWLGVDNNMLNIKTVQILNEKYGFNVLVARCIDHSLNLVFVAFLAPFEAAFGMQKLLRHVRAYIKAGGGQSRRAALVEHALSLSGIDFTATRWTSFLRAVLYLMGKQSLFELKRARVALKELAAWGDKSAAEALLEKDEPRDRWTQVHDALQSMGEDAKAAEKKRKQADVLVPKDGAGDVREVKLDTLLESFVDIEMWAAFFVVSKIFQHVPALFTVLQGDERFEPKLAGLSKSDEGQGPLDVAAAVRSVVNDLAALAEEDSVLRVALLSQTREACVERIEAALAAARKDDEPLINGKKSFDEADVAQYIAGATKALDGAMDKIKKVIKKGAKEFTECAGMDKVNEVLGDMELKVLYGLGNGVKKPPPFAAAALGAPPLSSRAMAAPVLDFFGVPAAARGANDLNMARALLDQWRKHEIAMSDSPLGHMTPQRAMMYWRAALTTLPDLAKLALLRLGRPNGNAAPERFMSLLNDMDSDKAQSMKKHTLYNVSMIRGNAPLVRAQLSREAENIKARTEVRRGPGGPSAAAAAAVSAAARLNAALDYAMTAALPAWATDNKGEGEEEQEEEKEEGEEEAGSFSSDE